MCAHSQNCKCTDLYQHVHSLTNLEVPDLRRNILTGCWQRTQHPDSTRPSQSFHSQPHTHVHIHKIAHVHSLTNLGVPDLRRNISTGCWQRTQHPDSTRHSQSFHSQPYTCTHVHTHKKLLQLHMYTQSQSLGYLTWGPTSNLYIGTLTASHTHITHTISQQRVQLHVHLKCHPSVNRLRAIDANWRHACACREAP